MTEEKLALQAEIDKFSAKQPNLERWERQALANARVKLKQLIIQASPAYQKALAAKRARMDRQCTTLLKELARDLTELHGPEVGAEVLELGRQMGLPV